MRVCKQHTLKLTRHQHEQEKLFHAAVAAAAAAAVGLLAAASVHVALAV